MVCGAPSVMSTTEPKMLELPADNWVMIGKVSRCPFCKSGNIL